MTNKYFPARIKSAGPLNSSQQHDNYRILFVPFKQFVDIGGNLLTCAYRTSTSRPLPVLNTQCSLSQSRGWIHYIRYKSRLFLKLNFQTNVSHLFIPIIITNKRLKCNTFDSKHVTVKQQLICDDLHNDKEVT